MLVVRFKETFRERMPEWFLATGMLSWGLITLAATNVFITQSFFHPLLKLMSQPAWGALASLIGLTRIVFLVINGAWRPSAHIRALGCGLGSLLWGALLISAFNLSWLTPSSTLFAMALGLDMVSLWFAAGDAKLADLSARGKLKIV